jgi:hypothetical protein
MFINRNKLKPFIFILFFPFKLLRKVRKRKKRKSIDGKKRNGIFLKGNSNPFIQSF